MLPDSEAASCRTHARFFAFSVVVSRTPSASKSGSETSESDSRDAVLGGDRWSAAAPEVREGLNKHKTSDRKAEFQFTRSDDMFPLGEETLFDVLW